MLAVLILFTFAAPAQNALPADVRAACDRAFAIIAKSKGIKTQRSTGLITDDAFRAPITGCRIEVVGSFKKASKSGAVTDNLGVAFEQSGWIELGEFSADGPDGTSFACRKDTAACLARGSWDGGSDDEPDTPAADVYKFTIICGKAAAFVLPR